MSPLAALGAWLPCLAACTQVRAALCELQAANTSWRGSGREQQAVLTPVSHLPYL